MPTLQDTIMVTEEEALLRYIISKGNEVKRLIDQLQKVFYLAMPTTSMAYSTAKGECFILCSAEGNRVV
jgi:hypothetical protein